VEPERIGRLLYCQNFKACPLQPHAKVIWIDRDKRVSNVDQSHE
jgi:hypothetical protein